MAGRRSAGLSALARTAGVVFVLLLVLETLLLGALVPVAEWARWWNDFDPQRLTALIRAAGGWGVAVSIGLMVLHSFVPFPAELVAIANGMAYGALWGSVITWVAAMAGACLAFAISRKFGRPFVRGVVERRGLTALDETIARHGGGAIMVARLIPVISFNLVNYAAGLVQVHWWTFLWSTGIGILPLTVLMVLLGEHVDVVSWQVWLLVLAALLVPGGIVRIVLARRRSRRRGRAD